MQGRHLFEYAVIRIVPKVEREEFLNAGIILFCKASSFLQCLHQLDKNRFVHFCPELDVDNIELNLQSFDRICKGAGDGGPIATLDLPSRFRWLTATRSTIIQTSKVHSGFSTDLTTTLQKLFAELVL